MEEKLASPTRLPHSGASSGVPRRHTSPRTGIWEHISVTFCPDCRVFYRSNVHIDGISRDFLKILAEQCIQAQIGADQLVLVLVFGRSRSFFLGCVVSSLLCANELTF